MNADEIKNAALAELGYTEEQNLHSDDDNGVNIMNRAYPRVLSLALQSYEWSFAKQAEEITEREEVDGKYKYKYTLPVDSLYLRGKYSDDKYTYPLQRYEQNGDDFYTDSEKLFIVYTKKVCEESMPAYFVEYLVYKLASNCCTKITGDRELLQELVTREQVSFGEAKNTDIKQQAVRIVPTGAFTDVRF
jgi:hypothetical protein